MDGVCYEPLESKADNPCYKCDDFTQKLEYFICKYHMNFSCLDLPFFCQSQLLLSAFSYVYFLLWAEWFARQLCFHC